MERPSAQDRLDPEIRALFALRRGEIRLGLGTTRRLMRALGDPAHGIPMVHIAGTNGKGSATAFAAAMLEAGGLRTGRFTSPHVLRVEERIATGGVPIAPGDFRRLLRDVLPHVHSTGASFFEAMTAIAALYFREQRVDVAVYEVGLGGRLDATNVIPSSVSVLTSVGNDHEHILGRGLPAVCREKLGIVKRGVPLFAALDRPDLVAAARDVCARRRAPFVRVPRTAGRVTGLDPGRAMRVRLVFPGTFDVETRLTGAHQVRNLAAAAGAVLELHARGAVPQAPDIVRGAARAQLPGRFQWLDGAGGMPPVVLDVGHNPQALRTTLALLEQAARSQRPVVVLGMLRDKRLGAAARRLAELAREIICTAPAMDRAWDPHRAVREFPSGAGLAPVRAEPVVADAVRRALDAGPPLVAILGSHYVLGEAIPVLAAARGVAPDVLVQGHEPDLLRAAV